MLETIILDLDVHDVNALILEPAFMSDNVFQSTTGLYKVVIGKSKYKMTHLSKPTNNLQPKTGCKNWNPTVSFNLRPDEIEVCEYEINGEQCPDEFDEACQRNLKPATDIITQPQGPVIDAIDLAMAMQLRDGLRDDFYKVAWFSTEDFSERVTDGDYDLSGLPNAVADRLTTMMGHCNGWFSELEARTSETSEGGKVNLVNTNDGTASGNALNPSNISDFLLDMYTNSTTTLRFWNRQRPRSEWPVYCLSPDLFEALISYYRSIGQFDQRSFIVDGVPVPGITTFNGFLVYEMPEWLIFDNETGSLLTTGAYRGKSKHQRALFTAKENLTALAHAQSIQNGFPGSSFVIQQSPVVKDKGIKYIFGTWGMGFGLAAPALVTLGINSSTTYTN